MLQKIKEDIKILVGEQKSLKNQRKTVNLKGERKLEAWDASSKHFYNKSYLRYLYLAYGTLRGKSIDEIEPKRKTEIDESRLVKLIEKYGK